MPRASSKLTFQRALEWLPRPRINPSPLDRVSRRRPRALSPTRALRHNRGGVAWARWVGRGDQYPRTWAGAVLKPQTPNAAPSTLYHEALEQGGGSARGAGEHAAAGKATHHITPDCTQELSI